VNDAPHPTERALASAERDLARLQARIETTRAVLRGLLQQVVQAESRMTRSQAALLLEVNEELVVAALRAQTDADTAVQELDVVARSAELDALTQLPNRQLLMDRIAQGLASARRHGGRLALLFIDLNDFKQINDTLGHAAGDAVLELTAQRLASAVREVDTVSRYGGDEFVILLAELAHPSGAARIADKLAAALAAPAAIGGQTIGLMASIGISVFPDDGTDAETLIALADAAMYCAKRQGVGRYAFHGQPAVGEASAAHTPSVGPAASQ